ncbi:MAG TPA: molecular chaperone HtpG, partial [Herbaspirillum sp.]|nr:molecular chaperone HtpG [Herbaspirillum sp.]
EEVADAPQGTSVTLALKPVDAEDGMPDYTDPATIRRIVRRYSDFITWPIRMTPPGTGDDQAEPETLNRMKALWARPSNDVSPEEYTEFYRHVSHDWQPPLETIRLQAEGIFEYQALLFLPAHAPLDLFMRERRRGVQLYVRRVFIMDDAEQLMPVYLRFVKGVIDSADLPLNVSREILQESRDVKAIREGSTKRVLSLLEELANSDEQAQKDKYAGFWTEFGQALKEGIGEDAANKERIARLLRFASTHHDADAQITSLADYIGRMKEGQDKIYYVTGENHHAARNSPHLEIFRKKGVEVLLLTDRVDEWMLSFLQDFDGKELASVAKGGLDLGKLENEAEKKLQEETETQFKDLVEKMKTALSGKAKDVRVTFRLTDSPACLVADEHELSGNLLRMLKAAGQAAPEARPILEINPDHPLVQRLKYEAARFDDWAHILFDQALLAEGGTLNDPSGFVKRLNVMLLGMTK